MKGEVDVLGYPSLIVRTVSVDVEQGLKKQGRLGAAARGVAVRCLWEGECERLGDPLTAWVGRQQQF